MMYTFAVVSILLCLSSRSEAAKSVTASCSIDESECSVNLQVEYKLSMMHRERSAIGSSWVPAEARKDGLYAAGGVGPAGCANNVSRKLSEEEADDVIWADGTPRLMFAVNGSFPGPPVVVYQGQTVYVDVYNGLESALTIHWHGVHQRGTPWMDGTAHISHCPVSPGETFQYKFHADRSGTYWYHGGLGSTTSEGVQGAFIVLPKDDSLSQFAADYTIVLTDLFKERMDYVNLIQRNRALAYAYGLDSDSCYGLTCQIDGIVTNHWPFHSATINGKGHRYSSNSTIADNPHMPLEVYRVENGSKYYFRAISSAYTYIFTLSIDGHPLHIVALDGSSVQTRTVDSIVLASGERADFYIEASDPQNIGKYWVRAESTEYDAQGKFLQTNHVEAILQYENGSDNGSDSELPVSERIACTVAQPCIQFNCPYKNFPDSYNTSCLHADSMLENADDNINTSSVDGGTENTEADIDLETVNNDVVEYFMSMKEGFVHHDGITWSLFNGVKNKLGPYPPQIYKDDTDKAFPACDEELCKTEACECTNILTIPLGQTVQLVLFSLDRILHQIHVHGYSPHIIKLGWPQTDPATGIVTGGSYTDIQCDSPLCANARWTNETWNEKGFHTRTAKNMRGQQAATKDTLIVPPYGYAVLRFKADNPGYWLVHCSMESHLLEGMSFIMQVGEPDEMPSAPHDMRRCGDFKQYTDRDPKYKVFENMQNLEPMGLAGSLPALAGSLPALTGSLPALAGSLPALAGSLPVLAGSLANIPVREEPSIEAARNWSSLRTFSNDHQLNSQREGNNSMQSSEDQLSASRRHSEALSSQLHMYQVIVGVLSLCCIVLLIGTILSFHLQRKSGGNVEYSFIQSEDSQTLIAASNSDNPNRNDYGSVLPSTSTKVLSRQ